MRNNDAGHRASVSAQDTRQLHTPVLLKEVLETLALSEGSCVIDATLGLGGYTEVLAQTVGTSGLVIGIEADERNLTLAKERLQDFGNIEFCNNNFRNIDQVVKESISKPKIQAVVFDLGLSSPHVDDAERGFAFQKNGPLDMRFDTTQEMSASVIVNTYSEHELIKILRTYGEEPAAVKITRTILEWRGKNLIETTFALKECIESVIPSHFVNQTLKRVFQALRIAVNDELNVLEEALEKAFIVLELRGILAVVTYHSLEEKIVKKFFKNLTSSCICPPVLPKCVCGYPKALNKTRKGITPTQTELFENPRSRSARLRAIQKI